MLLGRTQLQNENWIFIFALLASCNNGNLIVRRLNKWNYVDWITLKSQLYYHSQTSSWCIQHTNLAHRHRYMHRNSKVLIWRCDSNLMILTKAPQIHHILSNKMQLETGLHSIHIILKKVNFPKKFPIWKKKRQFCIFSLQFDFCVKFIHLQKL